MAVSPLQTQRAAASQPPRKDRTVDSPDLGQQDFLQLIIAQMRNQNPLEPQKNTEFIAQIAQFSMLEQLKSLNEGITALQTAANLSQASAMIGKVVLAKSGGSTNTSLARLDPKDDGAIADLAGLPPADTPPGSWTVRTEADGSVEATFAPKTGLPPSTTTGQFDAEGKLENLIPGVTLYAKKPLAGGTDTIIVEPVFGGRVDRVVMQKGTPKLLIDGQLVNVTDVIEITGDAV